MTARIALLAPFESTLLGLRSIGAFLKSHGRFCAYVSLRIAEEQVWNDVRGDEIVDEEYGRSTGLRPCEIDALVDLLRRLEIDVLGISTTSMFHLQNRLVTRAVRERLGIPVVWGGADATVNPDLALREADAVCIGDGEHAMLEMAEALERGASFDGIAGVWWKEDGVVRRNPPRPPLEDLDGLPFVDWSVEDYYVVQGERLTRGVFPDGALVGETHLFAVTGRGCPMRCAYCFNGVDPARHPHMPPRAVRRRSVANVLEEMRALKRRFPNLGQIYFADELFTMKKSWLREFCAAYAAEIAVPFVCYTYPGTADREIFELLIGAGLRHLFMGVQSGSDRTNRECYARRATREQALRTARLLAELGVEPLIELIVGNPLETEEDYRETARFLREMPRPYTLGGCYEMLYFRNFALTEDAEERGLELVWEGPTVARAARRPEFDFWRALFILTASMPCSDETFETLLESRDFRERPAALLEIAHRWHGSQFVGGHSCSRLRKDAYIAELELELATLRGSRAVRAWQALKRRLPPGLVRRKA